MDRRAEWITFVEGAFYPDSLDAAVPIYEPVLRRFGEFLARAADSSDLLRLIDETRGTQQRIQLLRVFRKYVSPDTSVEMLKKRESIPAIRRDFGSRFRTIEAVRARFAARPTPDEALIAVLNEYRERGKKGYTLTGTFFDWFEINLGAEFSIKGPRGAGKDLNLRDVFPTYPRERRPVDFVITETGSSVPLVVGLARYDSDRGGAQEDDRTGGYGGLVVELIQFFTSQNLKSKILLINDGPGLLLGSMWRDYCEIEESGHGRVMVATLKMLEHRLTTQWLRS
jgi:hypothetical protein